MMEEIALNFINGNLADARQGLQALTRKQLVQLVILAPELVQHDSNRFREFIARSV